MGSRLSRPPRPGGGDSDPPDNARAHARRFHGRPARRCRARRVHAVRTSFGPRLRRTVLPLLVSALVPQTASGDVDSRPRPILQAAEQFGVKARSERRWLRESPTPQGLGGITEAGVDPAPDGKSSGVTQARNGVSPPVYGWLADVSRDVEQGDYDGAYRSLVHVPKWTRRANQRQTLHIHALMGDLAARYVRCRQPRARRAHTRGDAPAGALLAAPIHWCCAQPLDLRALRARRVRGRVDVRTRGDRCAR